jgi:hypothetical protein
MKQIYKDYAILKAQIKDLENKEAEMNVLILEDMAEGELKKIETPIGKFSVTPLKRWTYPGYVTKANEKYKTLKAKAESTGEATCEINSSLRFTPITI